MARLVASAYKDLLPDTDPLSPEEADWASRTKRGDASDEYATAFGFAQEEVDATLSEFGKSKSTKQRSRRLQKTRLTTKWSSS